MTTAVPSVTSPWPAPAAGLALATSSSASLPSELLRALAYDDWRKTNPRFTEAMFEKNLRIVDEVEAVASELDATPAQIALAWLLAQGDDVAPIHGTKRVPATRRTRLPTVSS